MLFNINVSRKFTSGNLEGLTITQTIKGVSAQRAGKVGDTYTVKNSIGGGSYVDTTLAIVEA